MRKFLFLLFPAFVALSVLNCSGDNDMPCMTCEESFPSLSLSSSQSSHEYGYCLVQYVYIERCNYRSLEECGEPLGVYYGSDRTCGGWYDPDAEVSSSSRDRSSSSSSSGSSSSSKQTGVIQGTPVTYEDETYETVIIGNQTWMARNLNYNAIGSECYGDDPANCATYGRLYEWATAMKLPPSCNENSCSSQITEKHQGICPSEWHIPSNAEWKALMDFVGRDGEKLMATSGWEWEYEGASGNYNGTDDYGFAALPGGSGCFDNIGLWWSAEDLEEEATVWVIKSFVGSHSFYKDCPSSIRCIKD